MNFSVTDMTCGHCTSSITRAIKDVDAGARVDCDLAKRLVAVESTRPASEILSAIRAAGYAAIIGSEARPAQAGSCCGSGARNMVPHS